MCYEIIRHQDWDIWQVILELSENVGYGMWLMRIAWIPGHQELYGWKKYVLKNIEKNPELWPFFSFSMLLELHWWISCSLPKLSCTLVRSLQAGCSLDGVCWVGRDQRRKEKDDGSVLTAMKDWLGMEEWLCTSLWNHCWHKFQGKKCPIHTCEKTTPSHTCGI